MTEQYLGNCLAAWRGEDLAIVIPDDKNGIGKEFVKALAMASEHVGGYFTALQTTLYGLIGNAMNSFDENGEAYGPVIAPVEAFAEPIPSLPLNTFVVIVPDEEGAEQYKQFGIEEMDADDQVAMEASIILAQAAKEIAEEGGVNGSTD